MTFQVDWVVIGFMVVNAGGAFMAWSKYLQAEAARAETVAAWERAKDEASWLAAELLALRKAYHSALEHNARLAERAKFLAVELKQNPDAKTTVWRNARTRH